MMGRTKPGPAEQYLRGWIERSSPGDTLTYYEGYLPADKGKGEVNRLALTALQAYDDGLVYLTQKRLGDRHYCYRITKRKGTEHG